MRRPRRRFTPTLLGSAILATTCGAAAPGLASAADAPVRTISIDPSGAVLSGFNPVAVGADGREVVAVIAGQPVIRNVATNTTTQILGYGDAIAGVSTDLQKILFETTTSYSAADTNGRADYYLWNRQTGTKTLVDRDASGAAIGSDSDAGYYPGFTYANYAQLSGNGNVVQFGVSHAPAADATDQNTRTYDAWRFDVATGAVTKVADGVGVDDTVLDDSGKVVVTRSGFSIGSRHVDFPYDSTAWNVHVRVSPDGSAAAVWTNGATTSAYVVDLTTGTKRALSLPAWVTVPGFNIWSVTNGGTRVLMSTVLDRGAGARDVFGYMEQNGALAQYGQDVPITSAANGPVGAVSANAAFAATPSQLAQLGSTPIPGTAPVVTFTPKVSDYVTIADSECIQNFWYVTYTRPVMLLGGANGADVRTPVSAKITVTKTSTKQVVNSFTLTPKSPHQDLLTGKNGNFTATIHLTLSDGTVLDGTEVVAPHANPICPPVIL